MLYRFDPGPRPLGRALILMLDPDAPILCVACACEDEIHYRETGVHLYTMQRVKDAFVILREIRGVPWYEDEDEEMEGGG
jgi:hypothetical protein